MSRPGDDALPWRSAPLKPAARSDFRKLRRVYTEADTRRPQWLETMRAECWLRLARQNPGNSAGYVARMETHRQKAQASYADIGTTEEEIASLR